LNAIHQVVPILEPSAVGQHVLAARSTLRDAGYESEIFVGELHDDRATDGARSMHEYERTVGPHDVSVYHLAVGSRLADRLPVRGERLVVDYHNLTPMRFLAGWDDFAAGAVAWGRRQLHALAGRSTLGIGDSQYNVDELDAAGFRATRVVPILLPTLQGTPDPARLAALEARKRDGGSDWLFVGTLAPHKAQHDVVKGFAAYRRDHDPNARCHLVGAGGAAYVSTLRAFVEHLGLVDAVDLTGPVTDAEKHAYYATADVFVVCSEHEGFLVPLLEAMHYGVPIVAYGAAAVPETLGDAGILLDRKDPFTVAAAVDRVLRDDGLRRALRSAGYARLQRFSFERTSAAWLAALEPAARS
jgi:glycosyltransferase involved in cell wall biosynthesis